MPVLNGFELCKKIREIDNTTQIIFITNIASIQKPISNKELVKALNMALATKEAN